MVQSGIVYRNSRAFGVSLPNLFLLLHVLVCPLSQAQEKVLKSEVPDSKRAFLVLEIKPVTFLNHPVLKPFFGADDLGSLGIPVEA